jgi:hypothetical protein
VQRTAFPAPRRCFGLEQDEDNILCKTCPYIADCAQAMGDLAGRVNADKADFGCLPPPLQKWLDEHRESDHVELEALYFLCYERVFRQREYRNDKKDRERSYLRQHSAVIFLRIEQAGMSAKMFLTANMYGWLEEGRPEYFRPVRLTKDDSVIMAKRYAKICSERYGIVDASVLDDIAGLGMALEQSLLNSEMIVGQWIVNYRIFHKIGLIEAMYKELELGLHPWWLVIEPTYEQWLLRQPILNDMSLLAKHRWEVNRTRIALKRSMSKAVYVFRARAIIMPVAIRHVLNHFDLLPEHIKVTTITRASFTEFWRTIGQAIQHFECLKMVDGLPSIYDSLR